MKENVQLLQEINDLKKREHALKIGKAEQQAKLEQLRYGVAAGRSNREFDIPQHEET